MFKKYAFQCFNFSLLSCDEYEPYRDEYVDTILCESMITEYCKQNAELFGMTTEEVRSTISPEIFNKIKEIYKKAMDRNLKQFINSLAQDEDMKKISEYMLHEMIKKAKPEAVQKFFLQHTKKKSCDENIKNT